MVEKFVDQMQITDFEQPKRVLSLTSAVALNGKPWGLGTGCIFYLDNDARGQERRVGKVQRFLALEVDGKEEFFVQITEHNVL